MARYLLNISYIGTGFRGMQRQTEQQIGDPTTIQSCMEMALKTLKPLNEPKVVTSSRTDSGVHALHTTMHVDLTRKFDSKYHPQDVTVRLNKYFDKLRQPIRILKTYIVPDTFNCRRDAISRTYLYRLAVIDSDMLHKKSLADHIPIEDYNRCLYICTNAFDVNKAREAAKLFVGYHDFRTFMHKGTKLPDKITRRTIEMLNIEEQPLNYYTKYSWPFCINNKLTEYKFFHIYVKSNGFLYKQVRRIVASLIAVAQGKVTSRDIKFMIEVPSHRSWDTRLKTVPAYGLYLCEVAYPKDVLETFREQLES